MRTFLVLLLLSNIVYFGWNRGWLRELPASLAAQTVLPPRAGSPPPMPAAEGLTLLSELSEAERVALAAGSGSPAVVPDTAEVSEPAVARVPPVAPADPVSTPWCAELGPLADKEAAAALQPRLEALGLAVVSVGLEVPVSSTFWVYLPAFSDEALAVRTLAELQARGVDSYYMRSGQFAGGISLGVFSRRASAETVRADLQRQGYQPLIGEVFREELRYFLGLRAGSDAIRGAAQWAALQAATAPWTLTENVCESVATDI